MYKLKKKLMIVIHLILEVVFSWICSQVSLGLEKEYQKNKRECQDPVNIGDLAVYGLTTGLWLLSIIFKMLIIVEVFSFIFCNRENTVS